MPTDSQLPDDLDEIAGSMPRIPRGYSVLRQLMALLPNPLAAQNQGSFPVDTVNPPEGDPVDANQQIGMQPGTTLMDNAITAQQLADGAVTGAAFAATIRPVILVHGLPALPNASYPVDIFVYDIDAVPKSLWKNVANVWTRLVGTNDIQADAITAGQIAAGAVSTSELAVGARLTGEVANETGLTPGVFIDSTGILIRSGKLTLQDEFGLTTMQASGFSGTWGDFIQLGLYNATFAAGATGALPSGRTVSLPYWTITKSIGNPTATRTADAAMPGGYRVRTTFSALNDEIQFTSDAVAIVGGFYLGVAYVRGANVAAGTLDFTVTIKFYDAAGGLITSDAFGDSDPTIGVFGPLAQGGSSSIAAPLNARTATITITIKERVAHSASNRYDLGLVALKLVPFALDQNLNYFVDTLESRTMLLSDGSMSLTGSIFGGVGPIRRVYTANATWNKPYPGPGTIHHIEVECVGGGSGGGGADNTGAGQTAAGGGGGGGGYAKKLFLLADLAGDTTYTVVVGQGGAGGGASGGAGSAGTDSTFAGTGITTVQGGGASTSEGSVASGSATTIIKGGAPGGGASGGDINVAGDDGSNALFVGGGIFAQGHGGGSVLGGTTRANATDAGGAGVTGAQYGGGGSGAHNAPSQGTGKAGGDGHDGVVIVTEYYAP